MDESYIGSGLRSRGKRASPKAKPEDVSIQEFSFQNAFKVSARDWHKDSKFRFIIQVLFFLPPRKDYHEENQTVGIEEMSRKSYINTILAVT